MAHEDVLLKFMTRDGKFRGTLAVVTGVLQEIARRHSLQPTAAVALGRALAGGALLAGLLKDDQRVALKFEGNGPLKKILVEASHEDGALRGAVGNPSVDLRTPDGRFDVAQAIGTGILTVSKDLGLRTPYVGTVELVSGEIGEDLAFYLVDSEQIPSAVSVGAFVAPDGIGLAGGFLLQAMPPVDDLLVEALTARLQILPGATVLLGRAARLEDVVPEILGDHPYDMLERHGLHFSCTCNREKIEQVLLALGREELTRLAGEPETRVTCEFCRQEYVFSPKDVRLLARLKENPQGNA